LEEEGPGTNGFSRWSMDSSNGFTRWSTFSSNGFTRWSTDSSDRVAFYYKNATSLAAGRFILCGSLYFLEIIGFKLLNFVRLYMQTKFP
jgi:hypothetical protein